MFFPRVDTPLQPAEHDPPAGGRPFCSAQVAPGSPEALPGKKIAAEDRLRVAGDYRLA
jgi:hypothetical protein